MKLNRLLSVLCSMALSLVVTQGQASVPVKVSGQRLPSLAPMLEKVMPSVVNIYVTLNNTAIQAGQQSQRKQPRNRQVKPTSSLGSGVIVDATKGYIVTNNHLTRNAKVISVNLKDGRKFKAKLIGRDALSDIAVLQIEADNLRAIHFANSDQVRVGDFVTAIGNPFGLNQSVTSGIVSALKRTGLAIEGARGYENFIQIDAPINPGNSGGALVNLRGELIGINTAIFSPGMVGGNIGIGFAIPSNMAYRVLQQLIKYGSMQRGMVGMLVQDFTTELSEAFGQAHQKGAIVTQVTSYSPAAQAGLRVGDVIRAVNGTVIDHSMMVRNIIGLLRAGSEVRLDIARGKDKLVIELHSVEPKR